MPTLVLNASNGKNIRETTSVPTEAVTRVTPQFYDFRLQSVRFVSKRIPVGLSRLPRNRGRKAAKNGLSDGRQRGESYFRQSEDGWTVDKMYFREETGVESDEGGPFHHTEYPHGLLADELCSEPTVFPGKRYCYARGWQTWLKELEQRTAGSNKSLIDADIAVQVPGNLAISWDSEQRVVFSGCRAHACPEARAYFIVAPKKRELDIIWQNERGITYLGPNAELLRANGAYEWLKKLD